MTPRARRQLDGDGTPAAREARLKKSAGATGFRKKQTQGSRSSRVPAAFLERINHYALFLQVDLHELDSGSRLQHCRCRLGGSPMAAFDAIAWRGSTPLEVGCCQLEFLRSNPNQPPICPKGWIYGIKPSPLRRRFYPPCAQMFARNFYSRLRLHLSSRQMAWMSKAKQQQIERHDLPRPEAARSVTPALKRRRLERLAQYRRKHKLKVVGSCVRTATASPLSSESSTKITPGSVRLPVRSCCNCSIFLQTSGTKIAPRIVSQSPLRICSGSAPVFSGHLESSSWSL